MTRFLIGVSVGVILLFGLQTLFTPTHSLGQTASSGDLPGIYNATVTDLVLRDGYGSALATDKYGQVIAVNP